MDKGQKKSPGRPRKPAEQRIDAEQVRLPLRSGDKARMQAALEPGESLSAFVRAAVERELDRRRRRKSATPIGR